MSVEEEMPPNFGGFFDDGTSEVVRADDPTDAWTKLAAMGGARRLIQVAPHFPGGVLIERAPQNRAN